MDVALPISRPRVSIVTPAYNAAPYLQQALDSMLGQTFTDFEMIVVDDASTDATMDILIANRDPRLRVVRNARNLGVAGSRNRGMSLARGALITPFDADDVSLPTRLARQVAYLEAHPDTVLVGTGTRDLVGGEIQPGKLVGRTESVLLRWYLHVSNPFGHSTVMYRASAVVSLGSPMIEDRLAEDFEYFHQLITQGEVGFLNEPLVLYRRHASAISKTQEALMQEHAALVLERAYQPWFGAGARAAADVVMTLLLQRRAPRDAAALEALGAVLSQLLEGFLGTYPASADERAAIDSHAAEQWWGSLRAAIRTGVPGALHVTPPAFARGHRLDPTDRAVSIVAGQTPYKQELGAVLRRLREGPAASAPAPQTTMLGQVRYETAPVDMDRPAVLFVVVDCEAEFDWSKPFDRAQTSVTAMQAVERGQAVFDRYALRPVYVTDYAIVSQPAGYLPLRAIYERGGCALGAHLHPWINPPLTEALSVHNSYAGNLPVELERAKLRALVDAFAAAFGFRPRFFKAGRYGVGPHTLELLADEGIRVDFSVIPGRDLSSMGGPDFRSFDSAARLAADGRVLCLPMTRERIGLFGRHNGLAEWVDGPGRALSLPGVFSRLGLLDTVTLTPEGETAARQIALIRTMLARGQRQFVLHYHSPSLAPGFTPYGATAAASDEIVQRLDAVCRFFFDTVGGLPGNPNDLLPLAERDVPRMAAVV